MDLVLQKIKNEAETSTDVDRRSVSPKQHGLIDASSSAGCSRRAILKQRKFCHQCKRRPASIVENCADSSGPLRFCSNSCLDTYKLEVFTRETLLCLQHGPTGLSPPAANALSAPSCGGGAGGKQRGGRSGERVVTSPTKTRKRGHHPRPHPSHRLNKRYWDDLRAGRLVEEHVPLEVSKKRKTEDNQAAAAVSTSHEKVTPTVIQIAASAPPHIAPIPAARLPEPPPPPIVQPAIAVSHPQQQQKCSSSFFSGLIIIPVPIPIPIPFPFPLTEKFIMEKYGHLD